MNKYWFSKPQSTLLDSPKPGSQKSSKCVMSMDSRLRRVEPNAMQKQSIPFDQNIRLVTSSSSSLTDLGKHLMRACAEGNLEEVEALMSKGAPFLSDWLGTTPLHIAVQHNHKKVVQRLLIGGISKNCCNKVDRTPLHMAADRGFLEVAKVLVIKGADINCLDMLNMTPLHWAVQNGHFEVVRYLLEKGAKIDYKNKFGLTPIDIANQIRREDINSLFNSTASAVETQVNNRTSDGMEFLQFEPIELIRRSSGATIGASMCKEEPMSCDDINDDDDLDCEQQIEILHRDASHTSLGVHNKIKILQSKTVVPSFYDSRKNLSVTESKNTNQIVARQHKVNILRARHKNASHTQPNQHSPLTQPLQENQENNTVLSSEDKDDPIQLLQKHGISLMPNNDTEEAHILHRAIENGHSVVLTDAGKQILKSIEGPNEDSDCTESGKIITVTPEQFLEMMNQTKRPFNNNIKVLSANPPAKKMVMNKNKLISKNSNSVFEAKSMESSRKSASKLYTQEEMDVIVNQLVEAKKNIEEYKLKLMKKEQETERYKKQLKLLMDLS